MWIEYLTLSVYFLVLLVLGGWFSRLNRDLSDFVRGGARGTWWMVGTSITMAGISAFTFTGNGSAAFEAGPTLLVIYAANLAGMAMGGLFLAKWFRQTRAFTGADVIRARFGTPVEQFSVYTGLILGPLGAAVQLWALAVFVSSVFGFPVMPTIFLVGVIVTIYSVTGGKWAVMATDVVQGIILYGITLLVGILALVEIGGFATFFSYFQDPKFAESFRFFKEPGQFNDNKFTWQWALVIFVMQFLTQVHLGTAGRFLAVKDGREGMKASWWAFLLMAIGSAVWFIPPMVARFLYEAEVLALPIQDPATGAYAVAARNLLPNGLMGLMIAAMFAATMSSMDSGINGLAGVIVRNLIGRIREALAQPPIDDHSVVRLCRWISALLGITIIGMALVLAAQGHVQLFDVFLLMGAVIGTPIMLPLLAGLFIRKLPSWSYFLISGAAVLPTLYIEIASRTTAAAPWTIQERGMWVLLFGLFGIGLSVGLARWRTPRQREREKVFFETMLTPVDFEKEIGSANDALQARLVGTITAALAGILALLVLLPNPLTDRLIILGLAGFVGLIGALLLWFGRERKLDRSTE